MPNKVKLKRSATPSAAPTTGQLELGELAMNTYDGKLFFKKDVSGVESIVTIAPTSGTFTAQAAAPSNPVAGDRWLETSTGVLYTYFDSAWVEFGAKGLDDLQTVFSDPQITRVGTATGDTSATLPAHQIGDLIVGWAFRDGSTTNPTLPAGWTSLTSRDGTSCSARMGYKIAASTAETTGTWTNASAVAFAVYRNELAVELGDPTADYAFQTGTTNTVNYDGANLTIGSNRTWVLAFAGHRSVDTTIESAPSGLTNVTSYANATAEVAIHDTNAGVSSFSDTSATITGTASGWITETVTIEPAVNPSTYLDFPASPTTNQTYSYSNLTWKWNGVGWRRQALTPDVQTFSSSGTWTKPSGAKLVRVELWGAGGGGGGGTEAFNSNEYNYGGAGGGGGPYTVALFNASDLAATVGVTIGAGGTGGTVGSGPTLGGDGADGGTTSFGTLSQVGGGGGKGGYSSTHDNSVPSSFIGEPGGRGDYSTGFAIVSSPNPYMSGGGGGAGGGAQDSTNTVYSPTAGNYRLFDQTAGGTAGTSNVGSAGTAGGNGNNFCGGGGGGSSAGDAYNAGNGGNGGIAGGGGGGGASDSSGNTPGAGGNGGNGYAIVTTYF